MSAPFERPGKGSYTATPGSQDMISLLGGFRHQCVTLSKTEVKNLSKFYGFDPDHAKREAAKSHQQSIEEVKAHNEASLKAPSWDRGPLMPLPTEQDRSNVEKFLQAGDTRNLFREVETEGMRLMAYLSHFLQEGEDPVTFVHNLCRDAGYDTTRTGFVEPDDPDWEDEGDEPEDESDLK